MTYMGGRIIVPATSFICHLPPTGIISVLKTVDKLAQRVEKREVWIFDGTGKFGGWLREESFMWCVSLFLIQTSIPTVMQLVLQSSCRMLWNFFQEKEKEFVVYEKIRMLNSQID